MKVKVKSVNESNYDPDQYGNKTFFLEFEGVLDDKEYCMFKGKSADYFKIGEDVEIEYEEKESKNGKNYYRIRKPKKDYPGGNKKDWDKINAERQRDISVKTASSQAVLFCSFFEVEVSTDIMISLAKKFRDWLFQDKDNLPIRTSSLCRAVEACEVPNNKSYKIDKTLSDQVLKQAEEWVTKYDWNYGKE